MIEVYSENLTVPADTAVSFNNVPLIKGETVTLSGVSTINLNKRGVYQVNCHASAAAATTLQLYKNGIALPWAQSAGTNPNFTTLVQVPESATCCPASAPTTLQIFNVDDASATLDIVDVVITKLC